MKKILFPLLFLLLAFCISSCDNTSQGKPNPPKGEQTGGESGNEEETKDFMDVIFDASPMMWDSTYDSSSKELVIKKGYRNAEFPFQYWKTIDASEYSYAELSYSELSMPQISMSLIYSDKSFSTVYLSPNSNKAYIKLDPEKKDSIKSVKFQSTIWTSYPIDQVSVKIDGFRFVKDRTKIENTPLIDKKSGTFNDSISGIELSEKIAVGWNIGRTATCPFYDTKDLEYLTFGDQEDYEPLLDSNGEYEKNEDGSLKFISKKLGTSAQGFTLEGNLLPPETHEYISSGFDKGLKSIRINVTWFPHIIDENYTIDSFWMKRVKELVDWAIEDGYYVILNDHHSVYKYMKSPIGYACGYNVCEADIDESKKFLRAIWKQIAETFNGSYDEHLIFETLNEPRKSCTTAEHSDGERWPYSLSSDEKKELTSILNEYNQVIVDTIRESGGNNAKRFIMIPTYSTDVSTLFDCGFQLPNDSADNKLMVALHWYPMLSYKPQGIFDYAATELKKEFQTTFSRIYNEYTSKGIPVCMTEFNVPNVGEYKGPYSDETRYNCLYDFCKTGGAYKVSMTLWDDGMVHGVINRNAPYEATETFLPDLLEAWKSGWEEGIKETTLADVYEENIGSEISLIDSPVTLGDWGDGTLCSVSADKLNSLKEGSIIKMSFTQNEGFKNFAFHNGTGGWDKIQFTGNIYSEKVYVADENFTIINEVSDLYIQLSAEDAASLKDGFVIHGLNTVISNICVIL